MQSKICVVCKKPSDIIELYEGLYDDEMVMVCEACAQEEKIPLLRKPTPDQLSEVDKRYSVRERMERMSGMHKRRSDLSSEQQTVQRNLNRLRMPEKKQLHPDVVENYYWELNMARRRKKMTLNQVSVQTKIPLEVIEAIEKGKLPGNFEQTFVILEDYFGIKLLKHHKQKVNYTMPAVDEEKVLDDVRKKIDTNSSDDDDDDKNNDEGADLEDLGILPKEERLHKDDQFNKDERLHSRAERLHSREERLHSRDERLHSRDERLHPNEKLRESQRGSLKVPEYPQNLDKLTLNDLVTIKKKKEEKERLNRIRKQTEDLLGDDLDLL